MYVYLGIIEATYLYRWDPFAASRSVPFRDPMGYEMCGFDADVVWICVAITAPMLHVSWILPGNSQSDLEKHHLSWWNNAKMEMFNSKLLNYHRATL